MPQTGASDACGRRRGRRLRCILHSDNCHKHGLHEPQRACEPVLARRGFNDAQHVPSTIKTRCRVVNVDRLYATQARVPLGGTLSTEGITADAAHHMLTRNSLAGVQQLSMRRHGFGCLLPLRHHTRQRAPPQEMCLRLRTTTARTARTPEVGTE